MNFMSHGCSRQRFNVLPSATSAFLPDKRIITKGTFDFGFVSAKKDGTHNTVFPSEKNTASLIGGSVYDLLNFPGFFSVTHLYVHIQKTFIQIVPSPLIGQQLLQLPADTHCVQEKSF